MLFKKNQSGRSMVEMLGVLAIIGVLSVGGITGYRQAMDRNAANEWLNTFNLLAVEAIARRDAVSLCPDYYTGLDSGKGVISISDEAKIQCILVGYNKNDLRNLVMPKIENKNVCKMIFETMNPETWSQLAVQGTLYMQGYQEFGNCAYLDLEDIIEACEEQGEGEIPFQCSIV